MRELERENEEMGERVRELQRQLDGERRRAEEAVVEAESKAAQRVERAAAQAVDEARSDFEARLAQEVAKAREQEQARFAAREQDLMGRQKQQQQQQQQQQERSQQSLSLEQPSRIYSQHSMWNKARRIAPLCSLSLLAVVNIQFACSSSRWAVRVRRRDGRWRASSAFSQLLRKPNVRQRIRGMAVQNKGLTNG